MPTFNYNFGQLKIIDKPTPKGEADSSEASLIRTITLTGEGKDNLYFRAAIGESIELVEENTFLINDFAAMNLKSDGKPVLRDLGGNKELLVPIKFINKSATITQTISWQ